MPFLVEELVAAARADNHEVPGRAGTLLLRRWKALSPPSQQVVAAACLADTELTDRLLRTVLAGLVPDPDGPLREAVDAGVLIAAADRDGFRFRHSLLRAAVGDSLLPGEARTWHGR